MSVSILVPQAVAKKVLARLTKLAKTAGVDVAPVAGTTTLVNVDGASLECSRYTIGELPRQSGYRFVARLQHEASGNIVAKAPGEYENGGGLAGVFGVDALFDFRTAPCKCDHCGTDRRRKETFVLRDDLGQYLQIGRNCLADFLAADPAQLVAIAELAAEVSRLGGESEWEGYWGGHAETGTLSFVTYTIASIAQRGFVKTKDERDRQATRDHAAWLMRPLFGNPKPHEIEEWNAGQPTAEHAAAAAEALEWAKNLPDSETRAEYMWNLKIAAGRHGVGKNEGLLASLYSAYCRAMGRELEKKDKPAPPREGFAAEEGWIWKGQATLVRRHLSEGAYGVTKICTFRSTDGFEIVWFASASAPEEIGALYNLKGRVKRTEVRKGVHQTVIARAAWSPASAAAAA